MLTPHETFQEREKALTELLPKLEISRFTNWPGQIKSHNRSTAIAMLESVKELAQWMKVTMQGEEIVYPAGKEREWSYNQALTDLITRLDEEIKLLKGL